MTKSNSLERYYFASFPSFLISSRLLIINTRSLFLWEIDGEKAADKRFFVRLLSPEWLFFLSSNILDKRKW